MKFRDGHWMLKPNIAVLYAEEAYSFRQKGNEVHILAPCRHVAGRGDTMDAALNVRVFSPVPGVIGVEACHHRGQAKRGPEFALTCDSAPAETEETDGAFAYTSGNLTMRISKAPHGWNTDFFCGGVRLTGGGAHTLAHMTDRATGRRFMTAQLDIDVGECLYGLGERFGAFVKNGQAVQMWQGDGATCSDLAYKNVPFYLSNKGYGVFVDEPGDVSFEVGSENVERVQFSAERETLRFFVIAGPTPKQVLEKYTRLTGRPALPPAWSFGLWLSTSFTTDYDEETVTGFIQGMAQRGIPLSVFHFDCFWMKGFQWCDFHWDNQTFPDPRGMLARYKARGLHICVWINPYIAQNSDAFDEAARNGYLLRKTNGDIWQTDLWQAGMGVVDFTNPGAREWYREKLRPLLQDGVDCIKTDFGERIPVKDIAYYDGSDPVRMHNYYAYLYNQCVFELLEEVRGKGEAVVFARSATAGCQQFPCHWGGDNFANYTSMAETLRAGLSMASSGFGFWSHDISGFEMTAPAHVYKRWCQFGLLSSHSRLHGSQSYRVPWLFDEEACEVLKKFTRLKCRLMPYLYRMAVLAHMRGTPVMRPMFMEFPGDPACDYLDRQYMLGDSLLVAPVFREDGEVAYYLPQGAWTHILDGRVETGGRWMKEKYDFMSLPLWVRENTALPMGGNDQKPDYDYTNGLTLRLYNIAPGAKIDVEIPGLDGNTRETITVCREGERVRVAASGQMPRVEIVSGEGRLE